jgi:hypothetical protein
MSVALMLWPSAVAAMIAATPAEVAGILIIMLGRSTSQRSARTSPRVELASSAKPGSTSSETQPSTPEVW